MLVRIQSGSRSSFIGNFKINGRCKKQTCEPIKEQPAIELNTGGRLGTTQLDGLPQARQIRLSVLECPRFVEQLAGVNDVNALRRGVARGAHPVESLNRVCRGWRRKSVDGGQRNAYRVGQTHDKNSFITEVG
jgi:hypothetical protein